MGYAYAAAQTAPTESNAPATGGNDWYPDGYTPPIDSGSYAPGWDADMSTPWSGGSAGSGTVDSPWPHEWPDENWTEGDPPIPSSKTDQTTDKYLYIVYPAGTQAVTDGETFHMTVQLKEGGVETDYSHTGTVTFSKVDGDGTVTFGSGASVSLTATPYFTIENVSYTMDDSTAAYEDFAIRAETTVDGETIYDVRNFRCYSDYVAVEIVDEDGNAITSVDMIADEDSLDWTFYVKLTAMSGGAVNEDFHEDVRLYGFVKYEGQWETGMDIQAVSYAPTEVYDEFDSTEATERIDYISIPAATFGSVDYGYASVKMIVTRDKAGQDPSAPYDDNTGYCDLIFAAKKEI